MTDIPVGYKQTEVGIIPNDWKINYLGELSNFTNGVAHESFVDENGKFILVNSKFISSDGKVKKYSKQQALPVEENSILMVMSDLPNGKALAKCFYVPKNFNGTLNQRICMLKAKGINPYYLYLSLNRNKYYLSFDDGVKQTNLRKIEVEQCPIAYPPLPSEQQAIATTLSDMDELISNLDELIEKKKNIKKGAMQKLLSPKDGWITISLRDIAQIQYGFLFTPDYYTENGKYRVITISNVHDGEFDFENCNRTDRLPNAFNDYQFLHIGDILISMTGNVGRVCCVDREGGVMNYRVGKFKIKSNVDSNYLYHSLRQKKFLLEMIGKGKGGAQPNISQDDILEYELSYPPTKEEQQVIANILSDMDKEIEVLEQKKTKYENIKQGAMQKLLTGQIRLV